MSASLFQEWPGYPPVWSYPTGGSSLTLSNGVVYVSTGKSASLSVDALNASSGALLWSYQAGGNVTSPTVSNGVLYIGTEDNDTSVSLDALNASSGALLWSYQVVQAPTSISSLMFSNGMVYAGTCTTGVYVSNASIPNGGPGPCNNYVYALTVSSGSLIWYYQVGG